MQSLIKNELFLKIGKFIVAFGLMAWLVSKDLIDFSVLMKLAAPQYILVVMTLAFVNLALANWRWTLLLRARAFDLKFSQTMPLTLIADFFNFAIPGAIGGDVVKAYYIAQTHSQRKVDAVVSVLVDRILGLYGMVIMALTALVFNMDVVLQKSELVVVALGAGSVFILLTGFLAAALSRRVRSVLRLDLWLKKIPGGHLGLKVYDAFQCYRSHGKVLAWSMAISFASQMVAILFILFVGYVIGETDLPLATFLFAVPLGFIVSALPIAPAGIGVGQYAFLALFRMYSGTETNLGQTGITVFQVTMFLWGLLGGYYYLKKKKPKLQEVRV
jgi:uncharacterized protein (TIRG00374 family)